MLTLGLYPVRYAPRADPNVDLRKRILALTQRHERYGLGTGRARVSPLPSVALNPLPEQPAKRGRRCQPDDSDAASPRSEERPSGGSMEGKGHAPRRQVRVQGLNPRRGGVVDMGHPRQVGAIR